MTDATGTDATGTKRFKRRKANFDKTYCIVFDDVAAEGETPAVGNSAKVAWDKIVLPPSWRLET